MLAASFNDNPDERLRVYSDIASKPCLYTGALPGVWTGVMLRAVQDPWSRIRKLGREEVLRSIAATSTDGGLRAHHTRLIVGLLLDRWPRARDWYEREGLLLLVSGLFTTTLDVAYEENMLAQLLLRIVLPSLPSPQKPVSDAAADVAFKVGNRSKSLSSFTTDYIMKALEVASFGSTDAVDPIVVSGYLNCLTKLLPLHDGLRQLHHCAALYPLLKRLAVHPAASVRQYVAGAWALPSVETYVMVCETTINRADTPSDNDDWWRMVETLLMALQEQLTHYLCFPEQASKLCLVPRSLFIDTLHAVLLLVETARFEVSRMAKQVVPLLTQFVVRFTTPPISLKECFRGRTKPLNGCTSFMTLCLPDFIWFLALRRHVAQKEEAEAVRRVVAEHIVPLLAGGHSADNVANEMVTGRGLAAVLLCTYFPDCCCTPLGKELMNVATDVNTWRASLSGFVSVVKYAADFALTLRQNGKPVQQLLPLWLEWLPGALTHEQCLILEAVKVVIATSTQLSKRKHFSFAYYSSFDAPTMKDSGDDVPLGFHWLKQHFPTVDSLPGAVVPVTPRESEDMASIVDHLHDVVYRNVYASRGTEPSALSAIRSLMCLECEVIPQCEIFATITSAIISRLDSAVPNWHDALQSPGGKVSGTGTAYQGGLGCACDDWDDSDSETNVEGIGTSEEIKDAKCILSALLCNHFKGKEGDLLKSIHSANVENVRALLHHA
ncbi:hypothetical protein TRVL_01271 [Trypanosoma vivax]|nr:hypothetical protein TRVL_01271 [Trypanosoma vivax]